MTCLSTNQVVGFLSGLLPEREVELVERHLDGCPACRFLVVELAKADAAREEGHSARPAPTSEQDAGAQASLEGSPGADLAQQRAAGSGESELAGGSREVGAGAEDASGSEPGPEAKVRPGAGAWAEAGAAESGGSRLEPAKEPHEDAREVSFTGKRRPRVALLEGSRHSRKRVPIEPEGRYQIKSEHRRGGQARILVAYDTFMGREVAFKELITSPGPGGRPHGAKEKALLARRFLREARIAGRLTHPSIVHVYETGRRVDGTLYYTMPLVRGKTLAEEIAARPDLADRLELLPHFQDLCHGIAYAHSQGVLHRDIKPENVLIGEFGETVLLDWGLAKTAMLPSDSGVRRSHFEEEEALTELGMSLGTPAYMSPEQAAGELDQVDERSDIWGLGAVLYTLLCGEPPHEGRSAADIVAKVLTSPIVPLQGRCPDVPGELAAVAEMALRRDKDARQASAMELARQVAGARGGRRKGARSRGHGEAGLLEEGARDRHARGRRESERLGMAIPVLVLLLACALGGIILLGMAYRREAARRRQEQDLFSTERRTSAELLAGAARRSRPVATGGISFGSTGLIARSADGRWVAAAVPAGGVTVWRRADGWRSLRVNAGTTVRTLALSPAGSLLAVALGDGSILLWDVRTGRRTQTLRASTEAARALAFAADGRTLAAATGRVAEMWDARRGVLLRRLTGHRAPVRALVFCARDGFLASGSADGEVRVWARRSGSLRRTLTGHPLPVDELRCSSDGRQLGAVTWRRGARIWSLATGAALLALGTRRGSAGRAVAGKGAGRGEGRPGAGRPTRAAGAGALVDLRLLLWAARRSSEGRPRHRPRWGGPGGGARPRPGRASTEGPP